MRSYNFGWRPLWWWNNQIMLIWIEDSDIIVRIWWLSQVFGAQSFLAGHRMPSGRKETNRNASLSFLIDTPAHLSGHWRYHWLCRQSLWVGCLPRIFLVRPSSWWVLSLHWSPQNISLLPSWLHPCQKLTFFEWIIWQNFQRWRNVLWQTVLWLFCQLWSLVLLLFSWSMYFHENLS